MLGFGRIGQQVARRALGLGMRVVAYDPFVAAERFRELGVERPARSRRSTPQADFVTLHLPLNDETRGLLDAAAFAQMKDGVRIVNAAAGRLVDEDALVDGDPLGQGRRRRARRLRDGAVLGPAARASAGRRHAAPRRLDGGGAGPRRRRHRRAGRGGARGRARPNAVNIPVVDPRELEVLGPFVPLAAKLGRLAMELAGAWPSRIAVAVHGPLSEHDTRLLTVAALNGAFQGRVDEAVNDVNAPLIAAERGIEVSEQRFAAAQHYTNLVRVVVGAGGEEVEVAGTTIGPEHRLFLAGALGFSIDIELAPHMAFLSYDDVPGVIGRVGTMFGEAGVNIANMAVSRTTEGGKALMAFSIDSPAPPELVERVEASGFDDVRFIALG